MSDDAVGQLVEELTYPAFNPAFVPVERDSDTVDICIGPWTGSSYTVHDEDHDGFIADLLGGIDGDTHVEELLEPLPDDQVPEFAQSLLQLAEDSILFDSSERDPDSWTHLTLRKSFRGQDRTRLESRRVLVVGSGPMQTQVVDDLSSIGVEEVGVVDPVSDTHIDTQLAENVAEFETDSLEETIAASDFVVYTSSRPYPELESRINTATQESGTPWTSARIQGFDGFIGPTIFPGETGCFECYRERMMANVSDTERYEAYLGEMASGTETTQLRLPGMERMLAGYLMMDLVNLLGFGAGFTAGRLFTVSGTDLSIDCNDVMKMPRCDSCGKGSKAICHFGDESDVLEAANRFGMGDQS